jgi:carbonic anhydrase
MMHPKSAVAPSLAPSLVAALVVSISTAVGCATTPAATSNATAPSKQTAPAGIAKGESLAALTAGNKRFVDGTSNAHTWQSERVVKTGEFGQTPSVGVLSCADSRVPVEMVFDQGVGELFVVRVAST